MSAQTSYSKKLFFSITIALAVATLSPSPLSLIRKVNAQGVITAIPPRLDLKTDAGKTITADIKVRNDADISQLFTIDVQDFIVVDSIGTPIPVSSTTGSRWSLKNWISVPEMIPVDAHSTQVIRVTFKVPAAALPGGHYAMVTYQPHGDIKPGDLKKTGALVAQKVGTLIYLTINGPITQNATVTKFSTDKFHEQGPVNFNGAIRNLSDIHINPKGTISIYNPLNQKVTDINVDGGNIFPEVTRDFTSTWNQKWGWGKYRADLSLAYGTAGGLVTASIFFWLFPIRTIIYSLIAIISILIVGILLNKRNKKHQEELEKEVEELKQELKQIEK